MDQYGAAALVVRARYGLRRIITEVSGQDQIDTDQPEPLPAVHGNFMIILNLRNSWESSRRLVKWGRINHARSIHVPTEITTSVSNGSYGEDGIC